VLCGGSEDERVEPLVVRTFVLLEDAVIDNETVAPLGLYICAEIDI
jgi:hypothetical protein